MADTRRRQAGDGTTAGYDAEKTDADMAASKARAKYDPAMRKPDASSLDDTNVSPLGLAAAAAAKRRRAKATSDQAADALANR